MSSLPRLFPRVVVPSAVFLRFQNGGASSSTAPLPPSSALCRSPASTYIAPHRSPTDVLGPGPRAACEPGGLLPSPSSHRHPPTWPRILARGRRGPDSTNRRSSLRSISTQVRIPPDPEARITLLGLRKNKFLGTDGTEEGLKLFDHLRTHNRQTHLLLGIDTNAIKKHVLHAERCSLLKQTKLQSIREVEHQTQAEFSLLTQLAILEKRPYTGVSFNKKQLDSRVCMRAFFDPVESLVFAWYWVGLKSCWKLAKDDELRTVVKAQAPKLFEVYYSERAQYIAAKGYEYVRERATGRKGWCLVCGSRGARGGVRKMRG